jgi:carboxyl-terminal processing protease
LDTSMRAIVALPVFLLNFGALAQPCQPRLEYDEIVAVVTERFFDQTFNGLDWSQRVALSRSEVACADDADQVAVVVNSLLAELEASHTALYTRKDMHYWGLNALFTFDDPGAYALNFSGIWPEQRNGTWFAKHVFEGSPAASVGVLAGDELLAVDGISFSVLGFHAGVSALTLTSDGRTRRDVRIEAARKTVMQGFIDAATSSARILLVGDKRVGYFHLWTARDAILRSMETALDDFEDSGVDALIIDYRGGYGGTSEDYLRKIRASAYWRSRPNYFLIDDSVRSGKEMLAGLIKRDRLGTLVGSTTAGYFLGASPFRFADDKYLLLLAIGDGTVPVVPGIGVIEGLGIEPDVFVAPCRIYCSGRDPQLEKVMELIRA